MANVTITTYPMLDAVGNPITTNIGFYEIVVGNNYTTCYASDLILSVDTTANYFNISITDKSIYTWSPGDVINGNTPVSALTAYYDIASVILVY